MGAIGERMHKAPSDGKAVAHYQKEDDKAKGFKETGIKAQEGGSPGDETAQDMMKSPVGGKTGPVDDTGQ